MASRDKTPKHIKLDERNHVEKALLDQLDDLASDIVDLTDGKQKPSDTGRKTFIRASLVMVGAMVMRRYDRQVCRSR